MGILFVMEIMKREEKGSEEMRREGDKKMRRKMWTIKDQKGK